jgi:erythronate-4-phosphate dehydrogenase
MKIVADKTIPFLKGIPETFAEVSYLSSDEFTPSAVSDADALIVRSVDKCTRELLVGSRVRLITTATIGFDHIDIAYCDEAGIAWRNAPGCNAVSVAQYVLSSLLWVAQQKQESLSGKTIGIVGVGHVGKAVEQVCTAIGMRVLRNDPPRAREEGEAGFVSLADIAREADVITFHTPLEKGGDFPTYHLADASFWGRVQRKPWVINAARGGIHDTSALIEAKKNGWIGELILDCWENEPHIDRKLLELATVATPHIAGFSADGKANATRACLENILSFFGIEGVSTEAVLPPAPKQPVIDLSDVRSSAVSQAVFLSFCPDQVDQALRENPENFERYRANYAHPREFSAYTVVHASPTDAIALRKLGFKIAE